jgi:hypothetical protein
VIDHYGVSVRIKTVLAAPRFTVIGGAKLYFDEVPVELLIGSE